MEQLLQQLIAQNTAKDIALQAVVAMLDEIRPGSRDRLLNSLSNAAEAIENDLLAAELDALIEGL